MWHCFVPGQHIGTCQYPLAWLQRPCSVQVVHPWTRQCPPAWDSPTHRSARRRRLPPRSSAAQQPSALSHREKGEVRRVIQTLAGWYIPVVTFYGQLKFFTRLLLELEAINEKVVPCIGVLHIIYLQAAVIDVVAQIPIVLPAIPEYWQWDESPITRHLRLFKPANFGDSVGKRIGIPAVNHRWRPSQNAQIPVQGHFRGSTPGTFH